MKKGYWIVDYRSVSDETALREYGGLATLEIDAHGGKILVRTSAAEERRGRSRAKAANGCHRVRELGQGQLKLMRARPTSKPSKPWATR